MKTYLQPGDLVVKGENALKIAELLTSTSLKILQILSKEKLDVSSVAERLDLSEAYVSEQIQLLEEAGLIKANYKRGKRGVRKICEPAVSRIIIEINP
ncbi:MAG: ArsR family transcriptional regulator [Candidatus Bathyarchaeia archaeon]